MQKNLKPCPFCGGNARLLFSGKHYCDDNCKGYIIVKCQICGAAGKGAFYQGEEFEENFSLENTVGGERAINSWNMRVDGENKK